MIDGGTSYADGLLITNKNQNDKDNKKHTMANVIIQKMVNILMTNPPLRRNISSFRSDNDYD